MGYVWYALSHDDIKSLQEVTDFVCNYLSLHNRYTKIDTTKTRVFTTFVNFKKEKDFNKDRVDLYSAALFQHGCNVKSTVRFLGRSHIASHRNPKTRKKRLEGRIDPTVSIA